MIGTYLDDAIYMHVWIISCHFVYRECNGTKVIIPPPVSDGSSVMLYDIQIPSYMLRGVVPVGKPITIPCPYPQTRTGAEDRALDAVEFIRRINGRGSTGAEPLLSEVIVYTTCDYDDTELADSDSDTDDDEPNNPIPFVLNKAREEWIQFMDKMTKGPCMHMHDEEEKWTMLLRGGYKIPERVTQICVTVDPFMQRCDATKTFSLPSHIDTLWIKGGVPFSEKWIDAVKDHKLKRLAVTGRMAYTSRDLCRAINALLVTSAQTMTHLCVHRLLSRHYGDGWFDGNAHMPQLVCVDWYSDGPNSYTDSIITFLEQLVECAPNLKTLNLYAPTHQIPNEEIKRITCHIPNVNVSSMKVTNGFPCRGTIEWLRDME